METVSARTRLLHFAGGLFYFFFFLAFYTLPAMNLHALKDMKSFLCAFFFPLVLLIAVFARFLMKSYPPALIMLFMSNGTGGDTEDDNDGRKVVWFVNALAFLLPVSLISFDLEKDHLHSGTYAPQELIFLYCISAAALVAGYVVIFKAEKNNKLKNKIIVGTLLAALFAVSAWWAVCEITVMYEMIFLHPEVFRI